MPNKLRENVPQTSGTVIGKTTAMCILGTDMHVWPVKCSNCGFNEYVKVHLPALPAMYSSAFL
jgi:hypothetical protein